MTPWVVLFRGVGGATQLPVAPLRAALVAAGFARVATYINSGNAVLASPLPREEVVEAVSRAVLPLGFHKDVHAASLPEWEEVVAATPFPDHGGKAVHAAWLGRSPDPARVEALRALAAPGEALEVRGRVAYLLTPESFGTSRMAAAFDRGIGVPSTARNWNTVARLLLMAREAA